MAFYLALKEVWRTRGRFLLISLVIALITVLVLFIAGLAEGLGSGNIEYLSKLDAQLIVYQKNSELSISASQIGRSRLNDVSRIDSVVAAGPIGFASASIVMNGGKKPLDISLIGVEPGYPGDVPVVQGGRLTTRRSSEAVIDRLVAAQTGLKVGDSFTIKTVQGTDEKLYELRVAGISGGQQYFLRPSLITPYLTWDRIRPKADSASNDLISNIIAVKLNDPSAVTALKQRIARQVANVEVVDLKTAYEASPGYAAQQVTLNTQSYFTLIIGVLVLGGFFQIQMLQKVPQIGMLKAIGTPSRTVALAALVQIMAVTFIGVFIGAAGTVALAMNFPVTVPIVLRANSSFIAIVSLLLIGPIGGLVSIRYSLRIEPLKALGLGG